jgi:hypothetical protein
MKCFKLRRNSLLKLTKFTKTTDTSFVEFAQMFSRRGSEMLYLCLRRTLIVLQACDVESAYRTEGRIRVPSMICDLEVVQCCVVFQCVRFGKSASN